MIVHISSRNLRSYFIGLTANQIEIEKKLLINFVCNLIKRVPWNLGEFEELL